ncbi:hypothetical protein GGQ63_002662 [Prosthecomicrobium pneumaticum]|uniref:Uncharacterized protein n=1 Tax=Prosthecomicrobium pneumaticum TaxID=81895 RepID=A0A7W9L2K3_9HYPH|nr:hypothetical protein [Prosthecomicrobium pneumaticum]
MTAHLFAVSLLIDLVARAAGTTARRVDTTPKAKTTTA